MQGPGSHFGPSFRWTSNAYLMSQFGISRSSFSSCLFMLYMLKIVPSFPSANACKVVPPRARQKPHPSEAV